LAIRWPPIRCSVCLSRRSGGPPCWPRCPKWPYSSYPQDDCAGGRINVEAVKVGCSLFLLSASRGIGDSWIGDSWIGDSWPYSSYPLDGSIVVDVGMHAPAVGRRRRPNALRHLEGELALLHAERCPRHLHEDLPRRAFEAAVTVRIDLNARRRRCCACSRDDSNDEGSSHLASTPKRAPRSQPISSNVITRRRLEAQEVQCRRCDVREPRRLQVVTQTDRRRQTRVRHSTAQNPTCLSHTHPSLGYVSVR
jgi:hypothetical protein